MSLIPLAAGKRVDAREKNLDLQHRVLEPTEENKALLREYEKLAKDINAMPSRVAGLRMNFKRRDCPAQIARLMAEREVKMARLMDIEKILFPKT